MGILEELKFFSNIETEFYFPFLLVFLKSEEGGCEFLFAFVV